MQQTQSPKAGERTRVGMGSNYRSQHISTKLETPGTPSVSEFEVIDTDSKPSWKHTGGGSASVRAQAHKKAGWFQMTVRETPETGRGGKEVHFTFYKDAALELRDFLNESFATL